MYQYPSRPGRLPFAKDGSDIRASFMQSRPCDIIFGRTSCG
jgi:hypothetical protein